MCIRDRRCRGRHGLRPRGGPAGRGGQGTEQDPLGGRVAAFGRHVGDRITDTTLTGEPSRHMGKPAPEAPAFSMGSGQTNGNPEEGSPGTLLYAASSPPRLPARKPRTAQHQGWRNTKDGAARPKDRTAQHQGWSGATPKTEPRNVRDGAVQPKRRNRATSELERRKQKNGAA